MSQTGLKMKKTFPGFPKELFKFLSDLSKNNNREWFNANKERYRSNVVAPVCEFIAAIQPALHKISEYQTAWRVHVQDLQRHSLLEG